MNKNGYRRVLDWLRSGTVDISGLSTIEIELLLREARYFQISSLVFELEHVLEERRVFVLYTEEKKKKKEPITFLTSTLHSHNHTIKKRI